MSSKAWREANIEKYAATHQTWLATCAAKNVPLTDYPGLLEKLYSRCVAIDNCLQWAGAVTSSGYGLVGIPKTGRTMLVHRLAFILLNGEVPSSQVVMHSCSNKLCINPQHLSLGSYGDNLRTAWSKHERVFGESQLQTKIRAWVTAHKGLCTKLSAGHAGGMPDLLVLSPYGQVLFVELKIPGNTLSKRQHAMHEKLAEYQQFVVVLYTYEDAVRVLTNLWEQGAANVANST